MINKGRTIDFHEMIKRSPFKPLIEHMRLAVTCSEGVPTLLSAITDGDKDALAAAVKMIQENETAADRVKDTIRSLVPASRYLPVDRRDLLGVLECQEEIADTSRDLANLLSTLPLEITDEVNELLARFSNECVATCQAALPMLEVIEDLLVTGFKGPDVDRLNETVEQVIDAEEKSDDTEIELMSTLFSQRDEIDPVSLVFLHKVTVMIANLSNQADEMANRTRVLVNKN